MAGTRKKSISTISSFEESLTHLNQILEKMETGQLSLEDSLHYFEEGITLIRQCQKTLSDTEQKVQILTEKTAED